MRFWLCAREGVQPLCAAETLLPSPRSPLQRRSSITARRGASYAHDCTVCSQLVAEAAASGNSGRCLALRSWRLSHTATRVDQAHSRAPLSHASSTLTDSLFDSHRSQLRSTHSLASILSLLAVSMGAASAKLAVRSEIVIEQIINEHADYQRELHEFALAQFERDIAPPPAAAAAGASSSSASSSSAASSSSSSASGATLAQSLQASLRHKLLSDFLKPGCRWHALMRERLDGTKLDAQGRRIATPAAASSSSSSSSRSSASASSSSSASPGSRTSAASIADILQTTPVALCLESEWVPVASVPACPGCTTAFSFFKRAHHCRACGSVRCDACAPITRFLAKARPAPQQGQQQSQPASQMPQPPALIDERLCNNCLQRLITPRDGSAPLLPPMSDAEVDASIRAGVDAQVARLWSELHLGENYANLEKSKYLRAKADEGAAELQQTWRELEF